MLHLFYTYQSTDFLFYSINLVFINFIIRNQVMLTVLTSVNITWFLIIHVQYTVYIQISILVTSLGLYSTCHVFSTVSMTSFLTSSFTASCLLEQSEIIRGTAEQNMPGVLTWILKQLTDVQHSIASSEIGIENLLTISSIVKVSYFTPPH